VSNRRSYPMTRPTPPDECANCGAPIPRNARACPACGADERTGWRETSIYDGLDLPEDSDSDGDTASTSRRPRRDGSLPWYWIAVLVLLLVILGLSALGLLR
jgi:predicted nucleic acid-binding Zn ribbon protein